eukprot:15061503-Alexandrium_andersonii.AAC.1
MPPPGVVVRPMPKQSALGVRARRHLGTQDKLRCCKVWLGYVDDLIVRAGSVLGGVLYADAEHEVRMRGASSRARIVEAQSMSEALENEGFNLECIGSEVQR